MKVWVRFAGRASGWGRRRVRSRAVSAAPHGTPDERRWHIATAGGWPRIERRYLPDALVLETTFHTDEGSVRITDCMPIRGKTVDIVRLVEGLSGRVPMHMELAIRFDYGSIVPWVVRADGGLRAVAGPDAMLLRTPVHTHGAGRTTIADFVVEAGERVPADVLDAHPCRHEQPAVGHPTRFSEIPRHPACHGNLGTAVIRDEGAQRALPLELCTRRDVES